MKWYESWVGLLTLNFLRNDKGKVGQIRLVLSIYSLYMLLNFDKLNEVHLWGLGILLVGQIGEKIWKYVLKGIALWKGQEYDI